MLYANLNKIKVGAIPNTRASCPCCETTVISKCGKIKTWHWAHKVDSVCDDWHEPETEWHRKWKLVFGKENSEIVIVQNGEKHIADIQTLNGKIIELQNSPILIDTIECREAFYGKDMIWIINGKKFEKDFLFKPLNALSYDDYSPEFDYYSRMHGFSTNYKPKNSQDNLYFTWKRPRISWGGAKSNIYLDFGKEYLFNVKEGMGKSKGKGHEITKLDFIRTHHGDQNLLSTIISE